MGVFGKTTVGLCCDITSKRQALARLPIWSAAEARRAARHVLRAMRITGDTTDHMVWDQLMPKPRPVPSAVTMAALRAGEGA